MAESRRTIEIAPSAIVTVIAAIVFVWLWLQLWQLLMILALVALPFATLYPVVERVWLREYLVRDAVETHRRIVHREPAAGE